jgi:hypothetical protein
LENPSQHAPARRRCGYRQRCTCAPLQGYKACRAYAECICCMALHAAAAVVLLLSTLRCLRAQAVRSVLDAACSFVATSAILETHCSLQCRTGTVVVDGAIGSAAVRSSGTSNVYISGRHPFLYLRWEPLSTSQVGTPFYVPGGGPFLHARATEHTQQGIIKMHVECMTLDRITTGWLNSDAKPICLRKMGPNAHPEPTCAFRIPHNGPSFIISSSSRRSPARLQCTDTLAITQPVLLPLCHACRRGAAGGCPKQRHRLSVGEGRQPFCAHHRECVWDIPGVLRPGPVQRHGE